MNKNHALLVLFLSLANIAVFAQSAEKSGKHQESISVSSLMGTWEIDLRPSPDAAAYLKDFVISSIEDGKLKGVFYGTSFDDGRINTNWGKIYFAFTTADNSGTYFHSGTLENGKISGSSYSSARGFMMPWFSVRKK